MNIFLIVFVLGFLRSIALADTPDRWIRASSNNKGVWVLSGTDPGMPCASPVGGNYNTQLVASIPRANGDVVMKQIQVTCEYPWGFIPSNLRKSKGAWNLISSAGYHGGIIREEVAITKPYRLFPANVIVDGRWHGIGTRNNRCYLSTGYFNDIGPCLDEICQTTEEPCPGTNVLSAKYIVYNQCRHKDGEFGECQKVFGGSWEQVTMQFYLTVNSVYRVRNTLWYPGSSCTGTKVLDEEQYFLEGYGWIGFFNTSPAPGVSSHVDLYALEDHNECLLFWEPNCSGPGAFCAFNN